MVLPVVAVKEHSGDEAPSERLERLRESSLSNAVACVEEAEAWLAEVEAGHPTLPVEVDPALRVVAGMAASRCSRNARGIELLDPAVERVSGELKVDGLRALGACLAESGRLAEAWLRYQESLASAQGAGYPFGEAACHNNMGNLAQSQGEYDEALRHYRSALALFSKLDHLVGRVITISNLAAVFNAQREWQAARDYLLQAVKLSEELGDPRSIATALHNLGDGYLQTGERQLAIDAYRRSAAIHKDLEVIGEQLLSEANVARLLHEDDRKAEAIDLATRIADSLEKKPVENERMMVGIAIQLSIVLAGAREPGRREQAAGWLQRARTVAERVKLRPEQVQILERLARLSEEEGDCAAALQHQREAQKVERGLMEERSQEALRRQQVLLDIDRLQEQSERERTHREELERINRELQSSRDDAARQAVRAEKASAAKGRFLSVMSHELRTPVNAIAGAGRLLAQPLSPERHRNCLDVILSASESLVTLVNHQLDLARIEEGKVDVQHRPFSLRREVRAALYSVAPLAAGKELVLTAILPPALGDTVSGDGFRLRQVLINLLGNAVRFTETGAVRLTVGPSEKGIAFAVSDTGPGMTEATRNRIFEAFEQGEPTVEMRLGGSGLGLSISDQLVRLMGGRIGVSTTLHQGSTFTAWLPLTAERGKKPAKEGEVATVHLSVENPHLLDWVRIACRDLEWTILDAPEEADIVLTDTVSTAGSVPAYLLDATAFGSTKPLHADASARSIPLPCLPEDLPSWVSGKPAHHWDVDLPGADLARRFPLRILLVEDDASSRAMMREMLTHFGYDPLEARDGLAARRILADHAVDLVLSDLQMPGLSGEGLAGWLAGQPDRAATVMVGLSATRDLDPSMEASFDGFINKPLDPASLLEILEKVGQARLSGEDKAFALPGFGAPENAADALHNRARIEALIGPERYAELLDQARSDMASLLEALDAAAGTGDTGAVKTSAHRLAGIAAHYGMEPVRVAATDIEEMACSEFTDTLIRDIDRLRRLFGNPAEPA